MGIENTPRGERIHIGLFGGMNVGKSSLMNAITSQSISIVSMEKGTTTDPVMKSMELSPLGPIILMDTPGLDDESLLGIERIKKTHEVLSRTDLALIVFDAKVGITELDQKLIKKIKEENVPFIFVHHKEDLLNDQEKRFVETGLEKNSILVSSKTLYHIEELKELMGASLTLNDEASKLLDGLVSRKDLVLLVVPIDKGAPKGRLILPQQQVIRDILDRGAIALVAQVEEVEQVLSQLREPPHLIITDSQAFNVVKDLIPSTILLTSFSILFARYKGNFEDAIKGARLLDTLNEGDHILMAEGCTHHRQCGDIGTDKLPKWIEDYTGKSFEFYHSSGQEFKKELESYALIIHCGGCMLNKREMRSRTKEARDTKIPMTNYGMVIAKINGILERSLEPFDKNN